MNPSTQSRMISRSASLSGQSSAERYPALSIPQHCGRIRSGICQFLATHPASPALLVAQHVWAEVRDAGRDVHVDSWLWIREQMEALAAQGILRRQQRDGAQVWWLSEDAPAAA